MGNFERTPVVQTIAHTFAAILGGSGLIEILLRLDPFLAAKLFPFLVFLSIPFVVVALILWILHGFDLTDARRRAEA